MVAHIFNLSAPEGEAGGSTGLYELIASLVYTLSSSPQGLHVSKQVTKEFSLPTHHLE